MTSFSHRVSVLNVVVCTFKRLRVQPLQEPQCRFLCACASHHHLYHKTTTAGTFHDACFPKQLGMGKSCVTCQDISHKVSLPGWAAVLHRFLFVHTLQHVQEDNPFLKERQRRTEEAGMNAAPPIRRTQGTASQNERWRQQRHLHEGAKGAPPPNRMRNHHESNGGWRNAPPPPKRKGWT